MTNNSGAVSLELIPRSFESLYEDAVVASQYAEVTHINIPHLERFPISSTQAVLFLQKEFGARFVYIPHLVSADIGGLKPGYIGPCLLVSGDNCAHVPLFAREIPYLVCKVDGPCYVALDQYRGSCDIELDYLCEKINGGAVGVFTQPFFSINDVIEWDSRLSPSLEIFYGLCPVVSEKSKEYWENKNKVVFPKNFDISTNCHYSFAKKVILWARCARRGVYLMPIRVSVNEYLRGLFG